MRILAGVSMMAMAGTFSACRPTPVDVELLDPRPSLVALVVAHASEVFFLLRDPDREAAPAASGTLWIETSGGMIGLTERPGPECGFSPSDACYWGELPEPVANGERVVLTGLLSSGQSFHGTLDMMDEPPRLTFEDGAPLPDTVRVATPRLTGLRVQSGYDRRVTLVDSAFAAVVWTGLSSRFCITPNRLARDRDLRASAGFEIAFRPPVCYDDPGDWDSMLVTVPVMGYDANATAYFESVAPSAPALFARDASWGVEGIHGVFGSAAPRIITVVVTPTAN